MRARHFKANATTKARRHEDNKDDLLRVFVSSWLHLPALVVGVSCAIFAVAAGCTSKNEPPAQATSERAPVPGDRRTLKPVSVPDMSSAAESVRMQVRERYAALELKIADARTPSSDLADAYGEIGKLFVAGEYLDAAEPCFVNAQAVAPTDMRWPYYLGHVQRFRNEPAKAAPFFEQALRLQPDDVASLVWLGEMYLAQGRYDAAEPLFAKALSLQPRTGAALYGLGRVALESRDYARAVKDLEDALALAPQASRIHYPLALAYRGQGNQAKAEAHLRQRGDVDLPPPDPLMEELGGLLQNAAAYETRGAEAIERRQWPEAIANLRKAIELAPTNAFNRLNLGTALYLSGDANAALEQFEAALRLSPELPKAHFSIGMLMEARGRDREAIERFSAAITSDPHFVEARMQLADALRRNGHLEESLPHYAEVLKTNPAISQARFGHAMALVRLRRYRDARERLKEGMKTYADQLGFAHALARLLAAAPDDGVRDGPQAMTLMQQLLAKQQSVGLAETMAMTFAELGRFDDAVSWQRDAMAAARRAGHEDLARRMSGNLKLYEGRKPCRTPWADDDPVFYPRPQ